jgi:RHS repeat-associated protein
LIECLQYDFKWTYFYFPIWYREQFSPTMLVAEYSATGSLLRRYVHGPGADDPLAGFEGAGVDTPSLRYFKANHQGSIVAVTSSVSTLFSRNTYDDYGIPGAANATLAQGGRFQYTGQAWLPELKLYHYKARVYSPTLERFLQTDPIGYDDGLNIYAYVANDPVNKTDPTGTIITGPMPVYEIFADPNKSVDEKIDTTANIIGVSIDILDGGPSGEGVVIAASIKGSVKAGLREFTNQSAEKSLNKGIKSLEKQIKKHIEKIEEFKKRPTVRPGMENQSPSKIAAQQKARIEKLKKEIDKFKKEIEKRKTA